MARLKPDNEAVLRALQTLLIVQLAEAGLDNHTIRKIVGVDLRRVTAVATMLKKKRKRS